MCNKEDTKYNYWTLFINKMKEKENIDISHKKKEFIINSEKN